MKIRYFPDSDMLNIDLSSAPATGGGEDMAEGITLFYDGRDRLVSIEIDNASKRVDLSEIQADPAHIVDDSGGPIISFSISELAREWRVTPRTIQKTVRAMAETGLRVGKQLGPAYPIILSQEDAGKIARWREAHKPGRPGKVEQAI